MVSSALLEEQGREEDTSLQWDLYSQRATDSEIHFRENKIESIRSPVLSQGYAIRIIRKKGVGPEGEPLSGVGIAPGSILEDENDLKKTLRFALEASKITSAPFYQIPSGKKALPAVKITDEKIVKDQFGAAKDLAERVLALLDKEGNIRITFAKIRLTEIATSLENCFGLLLQKKETFAYFEAGFSPKSKENSLAEYWPQIIVRRTEDLELEKNIPIWAGFARDSAKASAPETGKYSLIVPPRVLSEMLPPVLAFQSSASSFKRGMTRWRNKGEKVWSDKVTITDDGLMDYGLATSPFDDEGIPQQKTSIIRKGEFQNYIANNMYCKFVSSDSTGNGVKEPKYRGVLCYNSDVGLSHTNVVMEGGDSSFDEMVRETERGILMEQFSWMTPDPITGTFGAEIRHAYLIQNGAIKNAIKGGVVNGNFFDTGGSEGVVEKGAFNSLDLISKDRHTEQTAVLPCVRFPEILISGS
jgi:predicted Zn-dependent protease